MNKKQLEKLSDKEKNLMMAKLAGWEKGPKKDFLFLKANCHWHHKSQKDCWQENPPNFLESRDEVCKAVAKLSNEKRVRYGSKLEEVVSYGEIVGKVDDILYLSEATARQRVDAFILAMKPDKP